MLLHLGIIWRIALTNAEVSLWGIDQALVIHLYSAGEPVLLRALGKCSWKLLGN